MKRSKGMLIALIVVLCVLSIVLTGVLGILLIKNIDVSNMFVLGKWNGDTYPLVYEETYGPDFDTVSVEADAASIIVKNSVDDKIHLSVWAAKNKFTVSDNGGKLSVSLKNGKRNKINPKTSKVQLAVPKDYDKTFKVTTDYGNVEVAAFPNAVLTAEADYGTVKVEEINDITAQCDYGNIEIGTVYGALNITVDFGNVDIENADIKSDSRIACDFGNIKIDRIGDVYVNAKCDLGNKEIKKNQPSSSITLTVKCDMGNVEIGE